MRFVRLAAPLLAALVACGSDSASPPKPVRPARNKNIDDFLPYQMLTGLVDPRIGTGGSGNVVPGALVPHGMVKLSPDTNAKAGDIVAYSWNDSKIQGFSHTHLEGPGGSNNGYSEVLMTATRGAIATSEAGYSSAYSHDMERAEPGYYSVELLDPAVLAELTATRRCGVHRYTFHGSDPGNILLDLAHSRAAWIGGEIEVVGDHAVRGTGHWNVHPLVSAAVATFQSKTLPSATTALRGISFYAEFSRPFDAFGTWQNSSVAAGSRSANTGRIGAYATFNSPATPIEVRLCLSSIDTDQAQKTFASEVAGHAFDEVRAAARDQWNRMINRVQVKGGSDDQQRTFYTALYHSLFQPTDYSEDGRFWSGEDGVGTVLNAADWGYHGDNWAYYADDWCMWDTFRTSHPLQLLLEPERRSEIVRSIVLGYERGGWLPKCTWQATGYSRVMIANPFLSIMADAYLKGFREYDVPTAYKAMRKAAMEDQPESLLPKLCGYLNQGTPPEYVQNGYVTHECDSGQSASMTLEYAFDDWALSRVADSLGNGPDRDLFRKRAQNYKNVFNPAHGFMQGRKKNGAWVEPFDPSSSTDFTEASSWIYTFFVPHDVRGLIGLIGGRDAFVKRLDDYFGGGHHDPSNEPGFQTPYLYLYAGAPEKTQKTVRSLLASQFSTAPDGLPGNDDAGAMSAWYVWGAIGLYPISPGDDVLLIGSPIFEEATLYLEPNYYDGKSFTVEAQGVSADNLYVQSAALDGTPLAHPFIRHADVVKGGRLVLQMGSTPSAWGSQPADAPASASDP